MTDVQGGPVELTRTEFDLLAYLLDRQGQALGRHELLNAVWGEEVVVDPRTVDNFVHQLKRRLNLASAEARFSIETVRGVGYKLVLRAA